MSGKTTGDFEEIRKYLVHRSPYNDFICIPHRSRDSQKLIWKPLQTPCPFDIHIGTSHNQTTIDASLYLFSKSA
jgi:hypothetical protein